MSDEQTILPRARHDNSTVQAQLEYLGEELDRLDQKILSADAIKDAVAAGMQQAVGSPDFWDAGFKAMGERTASAAGGLLLDGVWGTLRRVAWFVLAGFAVYIAGGWSALVSMFKLLFGIEGMKP